KMGQRSVYLAIAELRKAGAIREEVRPGKPTVRRVTDPEQWLPLHHMQTAPAPDDIGPLHIVQTTPAYSAEDPCTTRKHKDIPLRISHEGNKTESSKTRFQSAIAEASALGPQSAGEPIKTSDPSDIQALILKSELPAAPEPKGNVNGPVRVR